MNDSDRVGGWNALDRKQDSISTVCHTEDNASFTITSMDITAVVDGGPARPIHS